MAARGRSNPLALAVLTCLYERPMHPYEVAQTLRTRAQHEALRLNYGSLYTVVESLERRGLVRAQETVRSGKRPERTVYAITDAGANEMADWLAEMLSTPTKEYLRFEAALSLMAALPPDEVLELLRIRIAALEIEVARTAAVDGGTRALGVPRLFVLEGEYVSHLLRAELAWVQQLVAEIESGDLEGVEQWQGFHATDRKATTTHDPDHRSDRPREAVRKDRRARRPRPHL